MALSLALLSGLSCSDTGSSVEVDAPSVAALAVLARFDASVEVPDRLQPASLQVIVRRIPERDIALDTIFDVRSGEVLDLQLSIDISGREEEMLLELLIRTADGLEIFRGGPTTVVARAAGEGAPQPVSVDFTWVGPGAGAVSLQVIANTLSIEAGGTVILTPEVRSAGGDVLPGANDAIDWATIPSGLGTFDPASGRWTSSGEPGIARVIAHLAPRQLADTVEIEVIAAPDRLDLLSGGGQTANVGATLSQPVVFQLLGTGGAPIPGRTIELSASSGGSVTPSAAETDSTGRVSVSWTLGAVEGAQTLTARVRDAPEVAGVAQAEATLVPILPERVEIVSGNAQNGAVGEELAAALVFRVIGPDDAPLEGEEVRFTPGSDGGASPLVAVTDAAGIVSTRWMLGSVSGSQSLQATVTRAPSPSATARAVAGAAVVPGRIDVVSGNDQTGDPGAALPQVVTFLVRGSDGEPLAGEDVQFTPLDGGAAAPNVSATDASGLASTRWTLGPSVGRQRLEARVLRAPSPVDSAFATTPDTIGFVTLTIELGGNLEGTVIADSVADPAIACERILSPLEGVVRTTGLCQASYPIGTVVSLVASVPVQAFQGWNSGACASQTSGTQCSVLLTEARIVSAGFAAQPDHLVIGASGAGSGLVTSQPELFRPVVCQIVSGAPDESCSALFGFPDFPPGTLVRLTADPEPGSAFVGWENAQGDPFPGCTVAGNPICELTINQSAGGAIREIRPRFDPVVEPNIFAFDYNGSFEFSPIRPGDAIEVWWLWSVQTAAVSASFSAGHYLSADSTITVDDILIGTRRYNPLGLGGYGGRQSISIPANVTPGDYFYGMVFDIADEVAESDELDNTVRGSPVTVEASRPTADLVPIVTIPGDTIVPAGDSVVISVELVNQGNSPVDMVEGSSVTIRLYSRFVTEGSSDPDGSYFQPTGGFRTSFCPSFSSQPVADVAVAGLAPGASVQVDIACEVPIGSPRRVGLHAWIDAEYNAREDDKQNNSIHWGIMNIAESNGAATFTVFQSRP